MKVDLTKDEVAMAKWVGKRRTTSSKAKGRKDAHGLDPDRTVVKGDEYEVIGACGEAAVAKLLNRFWFQPAFRDRALGDVGVGIHVRSTIRQEGRLIVHEGDDPFGGGIFILVIRDSMLRDNTRWDVVGFIRSEDAKNPVFWADPNTGRPAFFVGQGALTPISELMIAWGLVDPEEGVA